MASIRARVKAVDTGPAPLERYRALLGDDAWSAFEGSLNAFALKMRGRAVWNVNSTARGGGVAELLAALIPYDRGAGIDERWLVIEGSPEFFQVTKKIHMLLHGLSPDGSHLGAAERGEYERTTARNAAALVEVIKPDDVAILHDPQTAGLVPTLAAHGVKLIWRSHVGVDRPNEMVRAAWRFLTPYVAAASAFVFSRRAYVWEGTDESRVRIIAPCIDAFSTKNQDLDVTLGAEILRASGVLGGSDGRATFLRNDGTAGRVRRRAEATATLPVDARIVLQVSRWDRLKDPTGVTRAFAQHVAPQVDSWLVLAGPAINSVDDDPEQSEILGEVKHVRSGLSPEVRDRVVIAQLPMEDIEENAAIVNALQRRADVVVQKSLAEGFGLTVAEAMWKSRPVVASRVGGIEDQLENGRSGILIDDPRNLDAFGSAVARLLRDRGTAETLGRDARQRVKRLFLAPRHLMEQADLVTSVV
ncbi:MAG TPA: glycosyltransferase [Candidatus Dormibacteraeota bacterium]|nr:glycosyltransferase [Candidatus Dormibacteraeota bacterium]